MYVITLFLLQIGVSGMGYAPLNMLGIIQVIFFFVLQTVYFIILTKT